MCTSGLTTGMESTVQVQLWIQLDPVQAPGGCIVAAAGAAMRGMRGQRIATGPRQAIVTTAWVLALSGLDPD